MLTSRERFAGLTRVRVLSVDGFCRGESVHVVVYIVSFQGFGLRMCDLESIEWKRRVQ